MVVFPIVYKVLYRVVSRNSICDISHRIHVWYIYLHLVVFNGKIMVNVGKYTIHGLYGVYVTC